jgi:putative flippase GtrA
MRAEAWRRPPWFGRLLRFGVTGLVATGIHVLVAVTLIAGWRTPPYLANAVAFLTATAFSYAINTLWSFSARMNRRTVWRYACVAALGCVATAAVAGAAQAAHLDYRVGILLVIALVTPVTFAMHSRWTYRASGQQSLQEPSDG